MLTTVNSFCWFQKKKKKGRFKIEILSCIFFLPENTEFCWYVTLALPIRVVCYSLSLLYHDSATIKAIKTRAWNEASSINSRLPYPGLTL